MSDSHDISKHVRTYIIVFVALLIGTALTVGLYFVHFNRFAVTVAIALIVATVKAALVAGWFMHLKAERKLIYTVLAFTAFFFAGMMALIIWSLFDLPNGTYMHYMAK